MTAELSQLWMRLTLRDAPPAARLPPGYGLRTFEQGDEDDWIALLNTGFSPWTRLRLDRILTRPTPYLPRSGIFFITMQDALAGSACMFLHDDNVGELGWVVVHPDHQGLALGTQACLAALDYAYQQRLTSVFLRTEDARRPAIRVYLTLGFEPEIRDETQPARWETLQRELRG